MLVSQSHERKAGKLFSGFDDHLHLALSLIRVMIGSVSRIVAASGVWDFEGWII